MRVFLFLLFLFFPLIGYHSQSQNNNIKDKSEVSVHDSWDFGRVKEGEVLKHNFVLKNESLKTLNIKEVNTSCGCTISKVKKKTLLAGESTSIEVRFNTKGYSGPTQQYVYVHTDNLDKPVIRFIIKTDIVKNSR